MIIRLLATATTLALLAACSPATEAPETGSIETAEASAADMAPAFTLVDAEGVERSLADFRGRTVVLEWTNEGCPYVQKHYEAGAMQALQREATGDGVVWLTIISSAPGQQGYVEGEAAREWQSRNNAAATHLLLDPEGTVGRLYDARTTPDMRIIDPEGRVLFVGGIDDRPTNKIEDLEGANNYVKAALADMEAGRPVATPFATPYGCSIKYADELEGA